jgi:hypothetical protein
VVAKLKKCIIMQFLRRKARKVHYSAVFDSVYHDQNLGVDYGVGVEGGIERVVRRGCAGATG